MTLMQMTNEDLTGFANQVKDLIADTFGVEGLMNTAVVLVEKGMFGKVWDKLFGSGDNPNNKTTLEIRLMRNVEKEKYSIKYHVDLANAVFAEGITATEEQIKNIIRRLKEAKDYETHS